MNERAIELYKQAAEFAYKTAGADAGKGTISEYNEKRKKINELNTWIKRCELDEKRELKLVEQLKEEITALENHTCHACGQGFHDENQELVLAKKRKELEEAALQALATNGQWIEHTGTLAEFAYKTAGADAGKGTIIESLTAGKFAELIVEECARLCTNKYDAKTILDKFTL